jgi:hypothetical protein
MSEKIEGAMALDGMIQGRTNRPEQVEGMLRSWVKAAHEQGLPFSLEMEGASFSVLAGNEPFEAQSLGKDPAAAICRSLAELVRDLIPPERAELLSTIRSVEYGRNCEIQTIYAIDPSGGVESHQRTVKTQTVAPPQKMSRRDMVKQGLLGLLVAGALLGISSLFVDYHKFFSRFIDSVTPFDAQKVAVNGDAFAPYFTLKDKQADTSHHALAITIQRTDAFPTNDADADRLAQKASTLSARLAVEALARGYLRVDYFGKDNKFLYSEMVRVAELRTDPQMVLMLPLPPDQPLTAVTLGY